MCAQELELIGSAIKAYKAALDLDPKSSASLQDLAVARYQRAVALRAQAAKADEAQTELSQAEVCHPRTRMIPLLVCVYVCMCVHVID